MAGAIPRFLFNTIVVLLLVWLLLPLIAILIVSVGLDDALHGRSSAINLKWYRAAWEVASFRSGLQISAIIAISSTAIAAIIGVTAAIGLARWKSRWRSSMDTILLLPILVPGLVVGIGILSAAAFVGFDFGYGRLIAGHVLIIMPYIVRTTYASLVAQGPSFEEAARTLGASELRILTSITLPLAKAGITAGMLFAFIVSLDEVPVSLFLADARSTTLPLAVLSYLQFNFDPAISAISAAQVLLTVAAALVLERIFGLKKLYGAESNRA
jgi:putative spermidine/putrescine transport system permease protein